MSAPVEMDEARQMLCLEALWEIEAIARTLPGSSPHTAESGGAHFVVRALAGRLLRLSRVLMSAIDDEGVPTSELFQTIDLQEGMG